MCHRFVVDLVSTLPFDDFLGGSEDGGNTNTVTKLLPERC